MLTLLSWGKYCQAVTPVLNIPQRQELRQFTHCSFPLSVSYGVHHCPNALGELSQCSMVTNWPFIFKAHLLNICHGPVSTSALYSLTVFAKCHLDCSVCVAFNLFTHCKRIACPVNENELKILMFGLIKACCAKIFAVCWHKKNHWNWNDSSLWKSKC